MITFLYLQAGNRVVVLEVIRRDKCTCIDLVKRTISRKKRKNAHE